MNLRTPAIWPVLRRLAAEPEERLSDPWDWPGLAPPDLQRRYAHLRVLELEQEAAVAAFRAPYASEAPAVAALAQSAFGELLGLLAALDDADLDHDPGGDWTIRQLLEHVLLVERRYRVQTVHAATRDDSSPLRVASPEALGPGEVAGGVEDWAGRLQAERELSDAAASLIADDRLERPAVWVEHPVDVRFRLHRFAAHLTEHSVHLRKVMAAIGRPAGEAAELCSRIGRVRGLHERRTPAAALAALDEAERRLVATLD